MFFYFFIINITSMYNIPIMYIHMW